jgi:hypothetical protein
VYPEEAFLRIEPVEIYSDATNAAIMRHPGRRFPRGLVQGDTLASLCIRLNRVIEGHEERSIPLICEDLLDSRDLLVDLLEHYKAVLIKHEIPLPFPDLT